MDNLVHLVYQEPSAQAVFSICPIFNIALECIISTRWGSSILKGCLSDTAAACCCWCVQVCICIFQCCWMSVCTLVIKIWLIELLFQFQFSFLNGQLAGTLATSDNHDGWQQYNIWWCCHGYLYWLGAWDHRIRILILCMILIKLMCYQGKGVIWKNISAAVVLNIQTVWVAFFKVFFTPSLGKIHPQAQWFPVNYPCSHMIH